MFESSRDHIWKFKISDKEISPVRRLEISTLDTKIQDVDKQPQSGRRYRTEFKVEACVSAWDTCEVAEGQSGCPEVQELWAL